MLAKGLNYAVAPERLPHDDFIVGTELAAVQLIKQHPNKDPQVADELRAEVVDVLAKYHPPKQICPRMRENRSVLWQKAGLGKAAVVMDTQEYKDKIKAMLTDEHVYKRLKQDPTRIIQGKITLDQYRDLYPTSDLVPWLCGSLKTDKKGIPLRPITDYMYMGLMAYATSKAIVDPISVVVLDMYMRIWKMKTCSLHHRILDAPCGGATSTILLRW